jgi:hypothetical protein
MRPRTARCPYGDGNAGRIVARIQQCARSRPTLVLGMTVGFAGRRAAAAERDTWTEA